MDRASIERELRNAEAALADARANAQTAYDAVETRTSELDATEVAGDETLAGLIKAESDAKGVLEAATNGRDRIMSALARNPQAPVISVNEPSPRGVIGLLEGNPQFEALKRIAPLGSPIGGGAAFEINSRDSVISSLRRGGEGMFAVGEGATGEALIAIDQRLVPPVEIPRRRIRIIDLITVGATDSDLVRYGKQTVRTDNAGYAAIAAAFSDATYTWDKADAPVENIGQFVKAPRETLLDQGALQTLIESQLAYGVLAFAESEIYAGTSESSAFEGIQTEADDGGFTIDRDITNETRLQFLHRGVTAVRLSLFDDPDAIVMHPNDYHQTLTETASDAGVFMLNSARQPDEVNVLWGLPVISSSVATEGQPIVGNFKLGATLWVRSGVELQMSDSNEDDFLKRLITFRAEFRAAFAVLRPHAFCVLENYNGAGGS